MGDSADYTVRFETSKGNFDVLIHPDWAPLGAARFHDLVEEGFLNDVRFFRVLENFVAQFGIHPDPKVAQTWRSKVIQDDPAKESNKRGTLTFATSGPNSRTTQMFINFADNAFLDSMGFSPFGEITSGMDVVDALYSGYGEGAPQGNGPEQGRIQSEGNAYLKKEFPELDHVIKVAPVKPS